MKSPNLFFVSIILFLLETTGVQGQSRILFNDEFDFLNKRIGDKFNYLTKGTTVKAARFMPQFLLYGIEEWTAPSSKFSFEGIPFIYLPFNLHSIDYLPLDLFQISGTVCSGFNGISGFTSSSTGIIELKKREITDSMRVEFRGYLGSVTGDPLIYVFTRPEYSSVNKNKIVPSGILSLSNQIDKLSYRLTTGYYGFYTAGFGNDDILRNINRRFLGKQNKQVLASLEAGYDFSSGRRLSLFSSFISYYGWEITPFITSFAHIESYLYTLRAKIENLFDGFDLTVKKEEAIGEIDQAELMPASKFSLSEISFYPSWFLKFNNGFFIKTAADINYNAAEDLSTGVAELSQKIFNKDISKWTFGVTVSSEYELTKMISLGINLRTEKNLLDRYNLSSEFFSKADLGNNSLSLRFFSSVKSPNLTELYSNFVNYGIINPDKFIDTLYIKGNPGLINERGNRAALMYDFINKSQTFKFSTEIFYHLIHNPIKLKSTKVIKTFNPGSTYRSAIYSNTSDKKYFGFNSKMFYSPSENLDCSISYNFIENSSATEIPENKIVIESNVSLPFNNGVSVLFTYRSRTVWDDFRVAAGNNFLTGTAIDGTIDEFATLDISYDQAITGLLFIPRIQFRLLVSNIFNKEVKYLPEGNIIGRAVILNLYADFL